MKKFLPLLFVAALILGVSACKEDTTQPVIILQYDGANLASPSLPAGDYEASARFPASSLTEAADGILEEVEVYIQELPTAASVKIYTSNGGLEPSTLVYESSIIGGLNANAWNTHTLTTELTVDGTQDLWVTITFSQSGEQRTIGCDPGPAVVNGDWLYDGNFNQWQPLRIWTNGGVDINWNIRARVLGGGE